MKYLVDLKRLYQLNYINGWLEDQAVWFVAKSFCKFWFD